MAGRVMDMEADYIVYKFYEEDRAASHETDYFFVLNRIVKTPVILVFDRREIVQRHAGIVESEVILKGVKTREEQTSYPDVRLW